MDISGPELGTILDLTDRQVRSLADQGVVVKLEHGRYDLGPSVRGYLAYKIQTEVARVQKDPGESRIRDLRADDLALRLEERSGALIAEAKEEALAIIDEFAGKLRSGIMSVPARHVKDLTLRKKLETELEAEFGAAAKAAAAGASGTGPQSANRAARRAARARSKR